MSERHYLLTERELAKALATAAIPDINFLAKISSGRANEMDALSIAAEIIATLTPLSPDWEKAPEWNQVAILGWNYGGKVFDPIAEPVERPEVK